MDESLPGRKTVALVAHDSCKADLVEWVEYNRAALSRHRLIATGTTGTMIQHEVGLPVQRLQSGPLGGTSSSALASSTAPSTGSCSSGTRSRRSPTTPM